MKEKTLEDFKNEVAISIGWESWDTYAKEMMKRFGYAIPEEIEAAANNFFIPSMIVARDYANHVKAIALQEGRNEGFKKGCELQKIIYERNRDNLITHVWNAARKLEMGSGCLDMGTCRRFGVPLKYTWVHNFINDLKLTRPELLNAPDAVSPFKTDTDEATGGK